MKYTYLTRYFSYAALLIFANPAQAHRGNATVQGFSEEFLHPWQGLDHLLVMLAIGLWSHASDGKVLWQVPVIFVCSMSTGVVLHLLNFNLQSAEGLIALSVVLCGLLIWQNRRFSGLWTNGIACAMAISHGYIHATDLKIDTGTNQWDSVLGLLLSTFLLICMGIAAGSLRQRIVKPLRTGLGGICLAAGMYLLVG